MTYGFVQQDSRPPRPEDNLHLTGRCFAGIKLDNRLPRGFASEILRSPIVLKEFQADPPAAAVRSGLDLAAR